MAPRKNSEEGAPKFVRFFGPVIEALGELSGSGRPEEVRARIAQALHLSEEIQSTPMSSGAPRFNNQVHWARFYLAKAGYIDASARGVWRLTDKARSIGSLSAAQSRELFRDVSTQFVRQGTDATDVSTPAPIDEQEAPPEASPAIGFLNHRQGVAAKLQSLPASGFERFCQRLLRESGFEEVVVTGRTGDGGIDGIGVLQVNPFVSFKVLFQCKKYAGSVTAPEIRNFRGAMSGRADKGIVITTGSFTADAQREASRDGVPQIELVDGEKIVEMLERLELGLTPRKAYEVDSAFFDEFET